MNIISTSLGDFKIKYDEKDPKRINIIHPSSNQILMVITVIYWWDKDGIIRSINKNKGRILKRLDNRGTIHDRMN